MTRQEFLQTIWNKLFRPGLIAMVLFAAIRFLYRTIAIDGSERQTTFILTGIVVLLVSLLFLNLLTGFFAGWLKSKLSEPVKKLFLRLFKLIGYIAPIAIGVLLYFMWNQGNYAGMTAPIIFILIDLKRIILGIGETSSDKIEEKT